MTSVGSAIGLGMPALPPPVLSPRRQTRQIKVVEAQAQRDSVELQSQTAIKKAQFEAQAEIERAKGVAEANRIIADGLGGHDGYLRYLWLEKVAGTANREVIYVPTEAALPILESTRLRAGAEK